MPQFDISTYYSQIFWLIIVFSFLYIFIYKFVSPTADRILYNRRNFVEANITNATQLAAKAKKLQEDYDVELSIISNIVETTNKNAMMMLESSFLSRKAQLHDELKGQIRKNLDDIELATKLFWNNADDPCINLATLVIEKITNQQADLNLLRKCYREMRQCTV